MTPTAEEIIAQCTAYEPWRPHTPQEQMTYEEMMQELDELRCLYFGSRRSMAVGLAITILKTIDPDEYWGDTETDEK